MTMFIFAVYLSQLETMTDDIAHEYDSIQNRLQQEEFLRTRVAHEIEASAAGHGGLLIVFRAYSGVLIPLQCEKEDSPGGLKSRLEKRVEVMEREEGIEVGDLYPPGKKAFMIVSKTGQ